MINLSTSPHDKIKMLRTTNQITILGALTRNGRKHSLSGTPDATFFSTQALTWSSKDFPATAAPPRRVGLFRFFLGTEIPTPLRISDPPKTGCRIRWFQIRHRPFSSRVWGFGASIEEGDGTVSQGERRKEEEGLTRLLRSGIARWRRGKKRSDKERERFRDLERAFMEV